MKEMKRIIKELIVFISAALLFACGVTSNSSSSGGGSPSAPASSIQTMSPGELARVQNQKAMELTPQNYEREIQDLGESNTVETLYDGLSNPNAAIRKRSRELLTELVSSDGEFFDELKKLQKENRKPDSWYTTSLVMKDAEKIKTDAKEAELKRWMGEEVR